MLRLSRYSKHFLTLLPSSTTLSLSTSKLSTLSSTQSISLIQSSLSNHKVFKNNNEKNTYNNYLLSLLLISSFSFLYSSNNQTSSCDDNNKDDKKLSKEQLINELKQKLDITRSKLSKQYNNKKLPSSSFPIMSVQFHGKDTYALELMLNKQYDIIPLISKWTSVLNNTINSQNINLNLSMNTSTNSNMNFMSIISNDKKSSISIRSNFEVDNIAVSIYKDGGFTNNDVKQIVDGYYNALLPIQNNNDQNNNIIIKQWDSTNGTALKKNKFGNNSNDDPISQLNALGVEVFDKSSNAEINWDSLAGYDNIKKDMDETIVSALKYPDIYDDVARKTRKIFESNRPKAILLEGPPGTGKH